MGLFDKLKFKKAESTEPKKEKSFFSKKQSIPDEKVQPVVSPDGQLVATKKFTASPKKEKIKKEDTGNAFKILIRPLITEKSSSLAMNNQYVFVVSPFANKIEIKKAVRKLYGVEPIKINIISTAGKAVRYGRTEGRTKDWKKAIITLAPGQKIEIQEGL